MELALGLPVVFLGVLLVLQLALVGRDLVLVTHAAREAARAAAVDPAAGAARRAAVDASGGLDPERLEVTATTRGDRVHVELRYRSVTGLPLVGALVPDPWLTAGAVMRSERGR